MDLVVSWVVALMEVMVGISLFSDPHSVVENLNLSAQGVLYVGPAEKPEE